MNFKKGDRVAIKPDWSDTIEGYGTIVSMYSSWLERIFFTCHYYKVKLDEPANLIHIIPDWELEKVKE